jgi:hypothetical protein
MPEAIMCTEVAFAKGLISPEVTELNQLKIN